MTDRTSSHTPARGVSQYIEWQARVAAQIEALQAEADAIPVAPTDKVRTLLRYALDELRSYDQRVVEAVVMGRANE
jgi:predicted transcriptional regulator